MGFFDLVNIRAINTKLDNLMPVLRAKLNRLEKYNEINVVSRN